MSNVPGVAGQGGEHYTHYVATMAMKPTPGKIPADGLSSRPRVLAPNADVTKNIRRHRSKKH